MSGRIGLIVGVALGLAYAALFVAIPQSIPIGGFIPINVGLYFAAAPAGLVLLLILCVTALRRMSDPSLVEALPSYGTRAFRDAQAIRSTGEQIVLALATWPLAALVLGGKAVAVYGAGFGFARLIHWIGCHMSPSLRAFGTAASLGITFFALVWSVLVWQV